MIFNEEFKIYTNDYKFEIDVKKCYKNNIVMSDANILTSCSRTLNQSQCTEWNAARRFRLSASSNIHSIMVRTRKSIEKLVNEILYPANIENASTKYGLSQENNAKIKYEKLNGCEVKKVGVIVFNKQL